MWAFPLVGASRGESPVAVPGLPINCVWSVGPRGEGFSRCDFQALQHRLSGCGARASCSEACEVVPGQGLICVSCTGRQILYH